MYSKEYLENFIVNAISNKKPLDLSRFSDPHFILQIKIYAIEQMQLMLYKLNSKMIAASRNRHSYKLKDEVKLLNPANTAGFLDYAIVTGIIDRDVILKSTMILGAKFEHHDVVINFSKKIPVASNVQEALNEALIGMQEYELQNSILNKKKSIFKRLTCYLYRRRVAIAFACLGIGCLVAAPFTAGVSLIGGAISMPSMLVTVGVGFAITSSLTAYLAHSGLDKRLEIMNERNVQAQDIREINDLIDNLSKLKNQCTDALLQISAPKTPGNKVRHQAIRGFTFTPVFNHLSTANDNQSLGLKIRRSNTF